ncbi:MAG: MBL fold metallo-hydrolase [Caldilineaceae bacterium]
MNQITYRQLNKDYAYWTEKRRVGQMRGGQVSGLLTHVADGVVQQNILFDAGLGTLEAIADFCDDAFWDEPLTIFITHGHIDHHAELMILSEIYCQRRGQSIDDVRPPLLVYCTDATQTHLFSTHRWGSPAAIRCGAPIRAGTTVAQDVFRIIPLAVDHFAGAVIFVIEFGGERQRKMIIGWDLTSLPWAYLDVLRDPALALFEATTWQSMAAATGHSSIEDLAGSGFLRQLQLRHAPAQQQYGAYFVHYSGWEDADGMLTDAQLKQKFDTHYPNLADVVRVGGGQRWDWNFETTGGTK